MMIVASCTTARYDRRMSVPTSLRLDTDTKSRLNAQAQRENVAPTRLAQRLIDEGLRMAAHHGVVFRDGPAGRRPSLVAGPDVAEVVSVVQHLEASGEQLIAEAADWFEIPHSAVQVAVDYYLDFRHEVDHDVERRRDDARQARDRSARRRDLLT